MLVVVFKKSKKSASKEICLMKKMESIFVKWDKDFHQTITLKGHFCPLNDKIVQMNGQVV